MKKSNGALVNLCLIAIVNVLLVSSCIKKEDPLPDNLPSNATFNSALSGSGVVLYSNRSTNVSTSFTGSFFSFSTGVSTPTAAGNTNFRLVDKGNNTSTGLYFANTYTDGQTVIDPTNFATSGLVLSTATAQDVIDAPTPSIPQIDVFASPAFLFQTSSGMRGILKVDKIEKDSNPATTGSDTVTTRKVTFSYKIVNN